MRTVYLEPGTFECHPVQNEEVTRIPFETDFFEGKCDAFIEGFRAVPVGTSGTRAISPWKPFVKLDKAQRDYEQAQLAEYKNLIDELYAEVTS